MGRVEQRNFVHTSSNSVHALLDRFCDGSVVIS